MQVIDECMQAYKLCFKIGFSDAKDGKQYQSTKNQELSVETQNKAYSEGCCE